MQRWYRWLQRNEEEGWRRSGKEEEHQKLVRRVIASGEGGAGLLKNHENNSLEIGDAQVREEEERHVEPLRRCEVNKKEWRSTDSATRRCKI